MLLVLPLAFAQIDPEATAETRQLYRRLYEISTATPGDGILFGMQNAFTEGRGWRLHGEAQDLPSSDIKKATGKDPVVIGYDFEEIGDWNRKLVLDQIQQIHKRGGISTLSWHMKPVVNDELGNNRDSAWDTSGQDVKKILNDEKYRQIYLERLDKFVEFSKEAAPAPIIFRPFHEHNYSWFWWGQKHCTRLEYIRIWHLTVDYLKERVHNLLYAYSPNFIMNDYEERYPGDNYVDIIGVDIYFKDQASDVRALGPYPLAEWKSDVFRLLEIAERRNKIPAITEIGNEGVWYHRFWTDYFGWPFISEGMRDWSKLSGLPLPKRGLSYAMIWRNDKSDPKHFFGPAPGHRDVPNFKEMMSWDRFEFME